MSVVVIDDATREKLLAAGVTVVEVRDANGAVVGEFVPRVNATNFELVGVPFTDEEIAQHMKEGRFVTAEEVEEHLRRLTKCE